MSDKTWNRIKKTAQFILLVMGILYIMHLQVQNASMAAMIKTSDLLQKLIKLEQAFMQQEKQEALKNPPVVEDEAPDIPDDVIGKLQGAGVVPDWRWGGAL